MKHTLKLGALALMTVIFSCTTENQEINLEDNENLTLDTFEEVVQISDNAIEGEFIVVFKEDESERGVNDYQATERGGSIELTRIKEFYKQKSLVTLRENGINENGLDAVYTGAFRGFLAKNLTENDVNTLINDRRVAFIEPNVAVTANFPVPERPEGFSEQELMQQINTSDPGTRNTTLPNGEFLPWGVEYTGRGNGGNNGRTAWVIDSGIAPHPDLRIITGLSRSFVSGENTWRDFNGHGTHVAGTLAARNNGSGVIGVAYGARLVAVKVLGGSGSGSTAGILQGVDYVYNNAVAGDVFNYSVGFNNRFTSNAIDNAFRRLDNRIYGALAAGNSNDNTVFYSPQRIRTGRTWMVGSIDRNNKQPSSFSNFGRSVDRWAPGRDVTSTWLNGGFNTISGTSMASPHVAGILLVRGSNTVRSRGNVSKGGYSKPRARR